MLYPYNEDLVTYVAKETIARYLREAKADHLVREAKPPHGNLIGRALGALAHSARLGLQGIGRRLDPRDSETRLPLQSNVMPRK